MNILSVGNSFAVDASTYVHQIAKHLGLDINIHVLYIPGCPINLHWKNFNTKDKAYEFYINGSKTPAEIIWVCIAAGNTYLFDRKI